LIIYNYTKNQTYLDAINNQLTIINNTWQLNRFGFTPEYNGSNIIGFDAGYNIGVTPFISASFYLDSKLSILGDIISKENNQFLNTIGRPSNYQTQIVNSSRASTLFGTGTCSRASDNQIVAQMLNDNYYQQCNYNSYIIKTPFHRRF